MSTEPEYLEPRQPPAPLIGHQQAQQDVLTLLNEGKLPHALLIHGPQGIGKRLFAERLAWQLLCGTAPDATPNQFSFNTATTAAAQLQQHAHGGYHLLAPTGKGGEIKIEPTRQILQKLTLVDEGWRVVIIDPVEDMTPNAANALLKTLEEPSLYTLLLLISHQPSRLLPTIISRCRQVRLAPLGTDETKQALTGHTLETPLEDLLHIAAGRPGYALQIDQAARGLMPLVETFMTSLNAPNPVLKSDTAESFLKQADIAWSFNLLQWWAAAFARNEQPQLAATRQLLPPLGWAQLHQRLDSLRREQLATNLTPQLALENALADVISFVRQERA